MKKFTRKYLKLARTLAEDNDACFSRKIGVVLVSSHNRVISLGYNGTARGIPHPDTPEYLSHLWDELLTSDDVELLHERDNIWSKERFVEKYVNCKQCPRRILDIPSGLRLDICPCAHAERNALASANQLGVSTIDSLMYCYCGVPCHDCAIQMIQAEISKVICLKKDKDYSRSSRGLFRMSHVELEEVDEKEIDGED